MTQQTPPAGSAGAPLQGGAPQQSEELAAIRAECERWKDAAARAQADLQNAKVRLERDRGELGKFAMESLLLRLLPTIDNFRRAFAHLPEELKAHEWVKGVAAIEQQLMAELRQAGLAPMAPVGKPVDPERHEVLLEGPGAKGAVIEVLEDGYELHGKVLRPAKVKVGTGAKTESR